MRRYVMHLKIQREDSVPRIQVVCLGKKRSARQPHIVLATGNSNAKREEAYHREKEKGKTDTSVSCGLLTLELLRKILSE